MRSDFLTQDYFIDICVIVRFTKTSKLLNVFELNNILNVETFVVVNSSINRVATQICKPTSLIFSDLMYPAIKRENKQT